MALNLHWRGTTSLTIEAEGLAPERLASLSAADIGRSKVSLGNAEAELGELFAIEGSAEDGHVTLEGDLRQVDRLGQGMSTGTLTIRGDVGAELGAEMTGGRIEVQGTVGDWAGAEMRGGVLKIRGGAGRFLGAAYPGSRLGMREGVILVEGAIGEDAGLAMRRGLIAVAGSAGDGLGRGMIAGSIFAFGPVGDFPGAGMKRGTLAFFEGEGDGTNERWLLPTFVPSGRSRPPFLTIYLRQLRQWGFPVPDSAFSGPLARYNGDLAQRGQGEIWVGP
ncbi:formylmethanofuran dehydrogenase subunit C [Singulisphaera acidiphila]|uniref:Formylmethanofuran dehydrogenase subunit C n=1 Tax=Singulisphaera acidiphila (strain ATCC BAA-1392 / DSM 18658 / VKM B-2454 / MOB10) TaxID=886293 RepID=L0DAE1_SINAD|nr:formylmethanofuran dehydrogenase subunit C [Singulisphaera acidiphila]AGA25626.1 formylmethanofuran dehydrogenase subunit C [Singulisphaera acidiphila DSM 18658]